ncbi:tRNA (guanine(37)-N(1))-methyltransferase [bacterium]|nr:tRNA (guanine(37)-N(1))-methyltransferase [bacterium]
MIQKAQQQSLICIKTYNPRDWCEDKHKQVDDTVYGGGQGMLLKAEPYLRAVESILTTIQDLSTTRIILLSPSDLFFDQHVATKYAQTYEHIIFICGRYE